MIESIEEYLDGGTIEIIFKNGESYCIDRRIDTTTENKLYKGYPLDDNSNIIDDTQDIKLEILKYLNDYADPYHFGKKVKKIISSF